MRHLFSSQLHRKQPFFAVEKKLVYLFATRDLGIVVNRTKVALLFGGQSPEHDVSIESAKFIYVALLEARYDCFLIGIDRGGIWRLANDIESPASDWPQVALLPGCGGSVIDVASGGIVEKVDAVFPVVHGPLCEDGTLQGLLKLANVAFVGPSVASSANCMDKDICKTLLISKGVPTTDYLACTRESVPEFNLVKRKLGIPVFIKPANMGSSVGVQKVYADDEYASAIKCAFQYDRKILIERFIDGEEVECAVLSRAGLEASLPGKVAPSTSHAFYTYQSKYSDDTGSIHTIPADLSVDVRVEIQRMSLAACIALGCEGMARVDLFLDKNGSLLINEINTIPGFTSISMYSKLWLASGISSAELAGNLIEHALCRWKGEQMLCSIIADSNIND